MDHTPHYQNRTSHSCRDQNTFCLHSHCHGTAQNTCIHLSCHHMYHGHCNSWDKLLLNSLGQQSPCCMYTSPFSRHKCLIQCTCWGISCLGNLPCRSPRSTCRYHENHCKCHVLNTSLGT